MASWVFSFLASGLLGFSAFCWFMRLLVAFWLFASSAFPVPLRQVVFWLLRLFAGLCGFWRLSAAFGGFGFSHPSGFLAFALFHWFLDLASGILSITTTLFESSLLRTSWGGTPTHPLLFRLFAEPLFESTLLQTSWGGLPPPPRFFLDFLQRLNCTPV